MGVDLRTSYIGLELANPLVIASCPLTARVDSLKRLEESGAAAAVLPSLFVEQINRQDAEFAELHTSMSDLTAESNSCLPTSEGHFGGPTPYLQHVEACKREVGIPIIASLNAGIEPGPWVQHARHIQDAGADALELNAYFVPTDARVNSEEIERRYLDLVRAVRQTVSIPLAVKIGSYFNNVGHFAVQLAGAGADGLVLFNRYLAPDLDTDHLEIVPDLVLSDRHELRLPLRWIATLRDQLGISLAASSGIHFSEDVIKTLLVGADVAMVAATVVRYGPKWLATTLTELRCWLDKKEYASIEQIKGSMSLRKCPDATSFQRLNYLNSIVFFSSNKI